MTTAIKTRRTPVRRALDWHALSDRQFNLMITYRLSMAIITAITLIVITR